MQKKLIFLIVIITISIVTILSFITKKNHEFYDSTVENVNLAIFLNEEKASAIPTKESGYYFDREKSNCSNEVTIEWDSISWSPVINANSNEARLSCNLYFSTTYREGILNGTDPVIKEDLVPIIIEENGTVKKADLTTPWYSYENKKWANAVILDDMYDTLNAKGMVHGATKQDGYVSLDGVDDYINLGLENYDFGSNITLAIKFVPNEDKNQEIFNNVEEAGASLFIWNTFLYFELYNEQKAKYEVLRGPAVEIGKEYILIGTHDGTTLKMYINGELIASLEATTSLKPSLMPFLIGANPGPDGYTLFSNINVYQTAIFNRALTEEEISKMNSEIRIYDSTGLVSYVDFTKKEYLENKVIPEDAVESYFVWIPKYRYKLWDLGNYDSLTSIDTNKVHSIPLIFGDYNTTDNVSGECTTPMESGASGNCHIGDYMTHPAFLSIPSTGFWVGKFETGYQGATTTTEAQTNTQDISKVIVKPNVYSWRGIQTSTAFLNSYNYQRNLDSHMMKNTEWGAVAYLQHSMYGSQTSVRMNNNNHFITGYAAMNEPTCEYTENVQACNIYCNDGSCNQSYNTSTGYLATTTGNIMGIYDMSGGVWEYMMAVMLDENNVPLSGKNSIYNSGFNGNFGCPTCDGDNSGLTTLNNGINFPENKYFDTYQYSTTNNFSIRILGDAIGESGPFTYSTTNRPYSSWYTDEAWIIMNENPWFARGSGYIRGIGTGMFAFSNDSGRINNWEGYRIILTPTKG